MKEDFQTRPLLRRKRRGAKEEEQEREGRDSRSTNLIRSKVVLS